MSQTKQVSPDSSPDSKARRKDDQFKREVNNFEVALLSCKDIESTRQLATILFRTELRHRYNREDDISQLEKTNAILSLQKVSTSLLKFCEIIRNKIASFDEYVYHPGMPYFSIDPVHLLKFHEYNKRNIEKRRLRMLFLLENFNPDIHWDIKYLKECYSRGGYSDEKFAMCLAECYSKLSIRIKELSLSPLDVRCYSLRVTDDPWINFTISAVNQLIDFKVGKMRNSNTPEKNHLIDLKDVKMKNINTPE